jgi:AraC family transcriptional regulator
MDPLLTQIALSFREMRRSPTGLTDGLFADSLRTMLAAHLLRRYLAAPRSIEAGKTRREKMDARRLRHVLDLVESRLGEPLQLREMAGAACLSPFHFSRIFRLTMGISPYQYVLDRRIEGAKRMLHAGHFDLVEIALRTGFGSQSNFNRAFKKSTGTTPGAFRGRV